MSHREIDARAEVYDRFIRHLIRGNVLRGEVYPLSVAAERTQQAISVADAARELGAAAVAHGSTGAGNDQVRFDVVLRVRLPEAALLTPIRELGLTRERATAWLHERGFPVPPASGRYSVNRGLWGTTFGGGWTHDPWEPPPAHAWGPPAPPPPPRDLILAWEDGLPVALDGVPLEGPGLVETLGEITRAHGIGNGIRIGETVMGIKGRIAFEEGAQGRLLLLPRQVEPAGHPTAAGTALAAAHLAAVEAQEEVPAAQRDTLDADGRNARIAMPDTDWRKGGNHPNWCPDGEHILMNLDTEGEGIRFARVRYDGTGCTTLSRSIRGSGHPTLHPDGRHLLTDAYPHEPVAYGDGTTPLRSIDCLESQETALVRIRTRSDYEHDTPPLRVDPHPAWDTTFPRVAFNACPDGQRRVFVADMSALLDRVPGTASRRGSDADA